MNSPRLLGTSERFRQSAIQRGFVKWLISLPILLCLLDCYCVAVRSGTNSQIEVQLFNDEILSIPISALGTNGVYIVDTGADLTCLDRRYQSRLGEPVQSGTLKTTDALPTSMVAYHAPEFTIGGLRFQPESVLCIDLSPLGMVVGRQFDGILGMDAMSHHVVSLNPDKSIFTIGDVVPLDVKVHSQPIPLEKMEGVNRYVLEARLNGTGPIALRIDTGANVAISLNQFDWKRVFAGKDEHTIEGLQVGAAGKNVLIKYARLAEVSIGTNNFTNVIVVSQAVPDQASTIGIGLIHHFEATFDFPSRVLYLQPGKRFGRIGDLDMSGLRLILAEKRIMIHSVREQSPAFDAGMRAGDEVLSINGKAVDKMDLKTIRGILKRNDGDEIQIEVRRDRQTGKYVFRLKKFI